MGLMLAFLLAASTIADTIHVEAEDAVLAGLSIETEADGFSGTGYVTGFGDGASLTIDVEVGQGVYDFSLRVLGPATNAQWQMAIGSDTLRGRLVRLGGGFHERNAGRLWLPEGSHSVEISGDAQLRIDYVKLVRQTFEPPIRPAAELSNPNATEATGSLFQFLLSEYGRRILSGQQELRDVEYIQEVTGYEVAIAGGDLIEYSPSRWERGGRPIKDQNYASVEDYIEWAGEDGIVAMMWHWNAPTELIGEWWSGFYTDSTTFNFAAALADPSSENYGLILRDIDAIAVRLKQFADADIPLLWRPLHEAAGGWFWWGARGAEPFKELWRLLYDRLTHHHELNNLIWVYTHEPDAAEWYPGDDVVDIAGIDIYTGNPRTVMSSRWQQMTALYGGGDDALGHHMSALTESGTLPNPSTTVADNTWWSWFSLWTDWPGDEDPQFIRAIDADYLRHVFGHELVLTRDELPDWRGYSLSSQSAIVPAMRFDVYPNPSRGVFTIRAEVQDGSDARAEVFDILGRRVQTLSLDPVGAGRVLQVSVDLGSVAAGVYLLRMTCGNATVTQPVVVAGG